MTIDLHGFNIEEATATLTNALFSFDCDKYEKVLKIICGKGQGIIELTVLNLLDKDGWVYIKNGCEVIVYKDEII